MYPPPERRWPGLVAAYVTLIVLLTIPAVPIYAYTEPAHKLLVIRVCTGIVLAFTLYKLVKTVHAQREQQPASDFEAAARPLRGAIQLAPAFEKWREAVTNSVRSRPYFEHILRPRLRALLDRRLRARFGIELADLPEEPIAGIDPKLLAVLTHDPARRRLPWQGIPLPVVQALVRMLEELS